MSKSIKKILAIILSIVMLTGVLPMGYSLAATGTYNGLTYMTGSGNTAIITGYTGSDEEVVIPEMIGGFTVVAVGDNSGTYNMSGASIKSVTIPDTVTYIGFAAFLDCSNLESVTIGNGLEKIDDRAFYGCSALTTVNYAGSEEDWDSIIAVIGTGNEALTNKTVNYYYGADCAVIGHKLEVIQAVDATCTEPGNIAHWTCKVCGKLFDYENATTQIEEETIEPLGHEYPETWKPVEEATCTTSGLEIRICTRAGCSEFEKRTVEALGHDLTYYAAKEATCTEIGWNAYEDCSRCDYSTYEEIAAFGHTETILEAEDATCTNDGKTEGRYCSACDTVIVVQTTIPSLGHEEVTIEPTQATCTQNGLSEGRYCTACNTFTVEQIGIPATGHSMIITSLKTTKEATCTQDGEAEFVCSLCNETVKLIKHAKGHTEVAIDDKDVTCTEDGSKGGTKCSVCGEIFVEPEIIKANGHTIVILESVEPTCTKTGLTKGKECSTCKTVFEEQRPVDSYGHHEVELPFVEPTCTETGLTIGSYCNRCGESIKEQEIIGKQEHKEIVIEAVAPTCTEVGYEEGKICSVCDTVTLEPEEIPALGHIESEEATCTQAQICTFCGEILAETLGHNGGTEATCTEEQKCTVCGDVIMEALGHDYVIDEAVSKEATCLEKGVESAECTRCGDSYTEELQAKGHTVNNWTALTQATCTSEGKAIGLCIGCRYNIQKVLPKLGHEDKNGDYRCDVCGTVTGSAPEEPSVPDTPVAPDTPDVPEKEECDCLCHAIGLIGLIFDLILLFQRIFGFNKTCVCGEAHY